MSKWKVQETDSIDDIVCCYCGESFMGADAVNYDISCNNVRCPKCKLHMNVSISCQYTATPYDTETERNNE